MTDSDELADRLLQAFLADPGEENRKALEQVILAGPPQLRHQVLEATLGTLGKHHQKLEAATAPPLRVGVVAGLPSSVNGGPPVARVRILPSGAPTLCPVFPNLQLRIGDEAILSGDQGTIIECLGPYRGNLIGRVDQLKTDTRELVLQGIHREVAVMAVSDNLWEHPDLKPGCRVRYDAQAQMVTGIEETVDERSASLVGLIPEELSWSDMGGLSEIKAQLLELEEMLLAGDEDLARQGLSKRAMALFTGKPGTGKTYAARILCADLRRRLGSDHVAYVLISAAELLDPYVGRSEHNVRDEFAKVRGLAEKGYMVIMVWDEIECLFGTRGRLHSTIVEQTLTPTLLAELDGMNPLGSFLMIGITNRPDLLDSAVMREGRLGDTIRFRGPNWPEAERIFGIHLRNRQPASSFTCEELAERAAAQLFTPQKDGPPAVAMVRFRDDRRETITCPDLVTGDLIRGVCERGARRAWWRGRRGGEEGITPQDLRHAHNEVFAPFADRLKPWNLMDYLDWPLDKVQEVVAVEPPKQGARTGGAHSTVGVMRDVIPA